MKKTKFIILFFAIFIIFFSSQVFGKTNPEEVIENIAPDGKNITLKMFKPKTYT